MLSPFSMSSPCIITEVFLQIITVRNYRGGVTLKKGNNISSLQDQNQLAQAQQSILHLQRAINQAKSHMNEDILEQIKHSMDRAERSLTQAENVTDDQNALNLVRQELVQQQQVFQDLTQQNR